MYIVIQMLSVIKIYVIKMFVMISTTISNDTIKALAMQRANDPALLIHSIVIVIISTLSSFSV